MSEDASKIVTDCCDARTLDVEDNCGTKRLTFIDLCLDIEEDLTRDGYNNEV